MVGYLTIPEKSKLTFLKIKKRHAKHRSEIRPRQKQGAHERNGLHGRAVPLAGVCDAALLAGDFEVEAGFALGHDVV